MFHALESIFDHSLSPWEIGWDSLTRNRGGDRVFLFEPLLRNNLHREPFALSRLNMDAFYLYGSIRVPRKGGCIPWRSRGHVTRVWQPVNISRTRTKPGDRRGTACHGLSGSPYRASVSDPPSPRQGLRPWWRRRRGFSKYSCPIDFLCWPEPNFSLLRFHRIVRGILFGNYGGDIERSFIYFLSVERQKLIFGNQILLVKSY